MGWAFGRNWFADAHADGRAPTLDFALKEEINRLTATFADRKTESAYRDHLATYGFRIQLVLQVIGITVFLSYGLLDVLTVGELANEFLTVRIAVASPLIALAVGLTALPKFRRGVEISTTFGFIVMATSVVYMIGRMNAGDAPPYIIGVLVVMIFSSCLMRVRFILAAPSYLFIGAAYCSVLLFRGDLSQTQIIAGYFFMLSVVAVAIVTIYAQEAQSRQSWLKNLLRRQDAARIERLLIDATSADRSKANFLSLLTHELRTPLHQIIGFSEILKSGAFEHENDRGRAVDNVLKPARELLKKLRQMLRYADATAGKLSFMFDQISIAELIDLLSTQLVAAMQAQDVRLDTSQVKDCLLLIDQHHANYALVNIIENALNASKPGSSVVISGAIVDDAVYRLEIRDQGCGMSEGQIATALEPFEQLEPARSRAKEGVGLGLTIAKRLLTEQGGALSIKSVVNVGTVVTIDLRRDQPATQADKSDAA